MSEPTLVQAEAPPKMSPNKAPLPLPAAHLALPVLAIMGYSSFFITGYASGLGTWRPVPLYIFCSFLLLTLQFIISRDRSLQHYLYVSVSSALALIYGGAVVFFGDDPTNFTHQPLTYIVINLALFLVFVFDAVRRWPARAAERPRLPSAPRVTEIFSTIAADFAGLAILGGISSMALGFLFIKDTLQYIPNATAGAGCSGYVCVSLNKPPLNLNLGALSPVGVFDADIGLFALGVCLLLVGIVGVLGFGAARQGPHATASLPQQNPVWKFFEEASKISRLAMDEVLVSLRLVLSPLIWLVPAFSIAFFAKNFTDYLANASNCFTKVASCPQNLSIIDLLIRLFTPAINALDQSSPFLDSLQGVWLGALAVATVLLAIAIAEHNADVFSTAVKVLGQTGRAAALTLTIFFYSLAAINAGIYVATSIKVLPFQIGPSGLLALLATIGITLYEALAYRRSTRSQPSS